ncbi:hypothetical protein [Pontibacter chitinilyticus]|uniref:hypothetical protein n=1 Tax=Pontibacter chitinilyticus TaxID=2674989 RepID=UPI00321AC8AF
MKNLFVYILLPCLLLSGCADDDFFQKDAQATPSELAGSTPAGPDSAWVVAGRQYDRSWFFRLFWGNHNRRLWTTPVLLPVFHMHQVKGGLQLMEQGGGFQTLSFHLQDSTGRAYALRSIDKNPVEVLSPFWRKTMIANLLRDQTSAANPYGALVVPVLARAAGVYHTNPAVYYVAPGDTTFGPHAAVAQGKLFLLEERYETPKDLTAAFSPAVTTFEDSDDALRLRFTTNSHHFDQVAFARARLLDLLLGDWDRHKNQWDWAVVPQQADTLYVPIPKDRDQVFFRMRDGLFPAVATSKLFARKFHSFGPSLDDVQAYLINASFMDERLLNEVSREQWQQEAKAMQAHLTDAVIEQAVHRLPHPIYKQIGPQLSSNLKTRRNELVRAANKAYEILAREVTIPGSDQEELFTVRRLSGNRTEVTVQRKAHGNIPAAVLYHRIFLGTETRQLKLYGLAGEDEFNIQGKVPSTIPIAVYGGLGEDKITDQSDIPGWKKMTRVYDTERGNEIQFGTEARDMTTRDVRVHAYDREGN